MKRRHIGLLLSLLTTSTFAATWTGGGGNTLFNNTANWDGGFVPTNGQTSAFSGSGTLTVTFPGAGYADRSTTEITTLGSIVFDTVGSSWLKAVNTVNWGTPFRVGGGSHGFNIEGTGNTKAQMLMSNALFKVTLSATAITNQLQSGFLNFYDPDGIQSGNGIVLGHDGNRSHYTSLEAGSTSRWNSLVFRGLGPTNIVSVNGGYHQIFNQLIIGDWSSSVTAAFNVTNGYLSVGSDTILGRRGSGATGPGVLQVSGGRFSGASIYVGNDSPGNMIISGGTGTSVSIHAGRTSSSVTGTVMMTSGSWTNSGGEFNLGYNGVGQMTMTGGTMVMANWVIVGRSTLGQLSIQGGDMNLINNADLNIGYNTGSTGIVTLAGGTLTARSITRNTGNNGYATLIANGGVFIPANNGQNIVANMQVAQLGTKGLTVDTAGLNVSMSQVFSDYPDAAGRLVKTGAGTLTLSGANAYSGSTVISNGVLKLGVANALNNASSIIVAGGTLDLGTFTVTNNTVSLETGVISNGALRAASLAITGQGFVQHGATLTVTDSLTKSGSGTAELYDNYGYSGSTFVNGGVLSLAPVPAVMTNCLAWFDASDSGTLSTNASGTVTNWVNKGSAGAALNAIPQASTGPKVLQNDLNGRAVLSLANVKGLWTRNNIGIIGGQDRTMLAVGCRTTSGDFYIAGMGANSSYNYFGMISRSAGLSYDLWNNSIKHPGQPENFHVICDFTLASSNGTACLISNGVFSTQSGALQPNTTDTPLYLGSNPSWANSGKLAEVIVFNRALTEQERTTVERYLKVKWFGSPTVLPTTTTVAVAPGATLNLNGNSVSVAGLSGAGSVTNGTLTVTASLCLTNGVTANLLVNSNLTVAAGTALCYDYTATTSDVVNVTGTLTLQGAGNPVTLNGIGAITPPPKRITLFTFGTVAGDTSGWTVQGALQPGYSYQVRTDANSVYISVAPMGTMIRFF